MGRRLSTLLVPLVAAAAITLAAAPAVACEGTERPPAATGDDDDRAGALAGSSKAEELARVPARRGAGAAADSSARCVRGQARSRGAAFPCHRVDLRSWLDYDDLGGGGVEITFVNDVWGWSHDGRDYTLLGTSEGTVIVDVTRPRRPDVLGIMLTGSSVGDAFWRDIKVYEDHAYVVSEHTGHPVQVLDLRRVVGVEDYTVFAPDAVYHGTEAHPIGHAHNIAIDEASGYAYVVGSASCEGGLHMVDIREPAEPVFAGCYGRDGYIHDVECTVYRGPDRAHRGRQVCFGANPTTTPQGRRVNRVVVVDVTDKRAPERLSRIGYPRAAYSHQGSLTTDQRFFLHGDELDEAWDKTNRTTTRVFSVRDLDRPRLRGTARSTSGAIDHNLYTDARYAYASNYTAGLRVLGLGGVARGRLAEKGFFDVHPENDRPVFEGTWSNYADFEQQRLVAVSSIDRGLFLVRPRLPGQG